MEREEEVIAAERGGCLDWLVRLITLNRFGVETRIVGFEGFEDQHTGETISDPIESGLDPETGTRRQIGRVTPKPIIERKLIRTR